MNLITLFKGPRNRFPIYILIVIIVVGCTNFYKFRENYTSATDLLNNTDGLTEKPFLKAHTNAGEVIILYDTWSVDTITNIVLGEGKKFDVKRKLVSEGPQSISIDSVAIFETNTKLVGKEQGRIAALALLGTLNASLGVICLTVPKACFGSCPTFYMNDDNNVFHSDAEGFSNAIAPSLQTFDIDALNNGKITEKDFSLYMKNEALETHVVKDLNLYVFERLENERVFHSRENKFYLCNEPISALSANSGSKNFVEEISYLDESEWFSYADENDINTREELFFNFNSSELSKNESLGLVVNFRQTLMTTYLIYSALDYMGDMAGDLLAEYGRKKNTKKELSGIYNLLGGIDIYVWNESKNSWIQQGSFYETGPIARNLQILPFKDLTPVNGEEVKIKIELTKGLWRLDFLGLANIIKEVSPVILEPVSVTYLKPQNESFLNDLNDKSREILSMPGDEYKFDFTLPKDNSDFELFLFSEGYYLEWMRDEWLLDRDLLKLRQMIYKPEKYLKSEASNYKAYELYMEEQFWNSKVNTEIYSYYD